MVLEGLHFKYTITDINYLALGGGGVDVSHALYFKPKGRCVVEAAFSITESTITSFFPSTSIMKEMWRKRKGCNRETQWKWDGLQGDRKTREEKKASFSGISPPPSSSVYLIASLIGSARGHRRTWLRMESPVCRVVLSNVALVCLSVSSLFFADQTLRWNGSLF